MKRTTTYDCNFSTSIRFFPLEDICIKYPLPNSVVLDFLVVRYPLLFQRCFKNLLGATGDKTSEGISIWKTWNGQRVLETRSL